MIRHLICLSMLLALTVVVATPAVAQIENELLVKLNRIQSLVGRTIVLAAEGLNYTEERVALASETENLHVVHLLLQGRFEDASLNFASDAIASSRHAESFTHYQLILENVLAKLDALMLKPNFSLSALDELQEVLKLLLVQRPRPIHGALPYRQLSLPMFTADTTAKITPAYSSENVQPTADDLQESPAVERSLEIVELARSLDWNPVRMYEWVVNNIATEWYWGAMKGARQTLLQGRGNDADQAALLVALMRASGYPARFIKGKVGLFPTVETGLQRLGLSNIEELMRLLQKAGIPYEPVIAGGRVADVAFEHLWCEVYVPYSNYRGTVLDAEGKSWVPLDTSLKPLTSIITPPEVSVDNFDYASVVTQFLSAHQSDSPLNYLRAQLALHQNNPDFDFGDLLPQIITPSLKLDLLPASTQFKEYVVTGEFSDLPPELLPMAQVTATDANGVQLYAFDLPLYRLIDQPLVLDADPETTADQQLAAEYGGFETTPPYLLNLRPLLRLGSERVAVAGSGLAMGDHYRLRLRLVTSTGATETETVQVVGGLAAIAVGSGESAAAIEPSGLAAVDLMYATALKYNASWQKDEDLLAQLLRLPLVRTLPAVTIVGSSYNISWLDNRPYAMQWEGLFMDAAIRVAEPVTEASEISRSFMRLSGLQGSWLEAATLFEDYQVPAIATADLFGRAIEAGVEMLSIDSGNLDTSLAVLPFADNVKTDIRNATNQGWSVSIPVQNINYLAWNGIGYIIEDPQSGEAGYMLTGGLAGAQTADIQWADDYRAQFASARSEPPNLDPLAAADIVFLPAGDRQNGIVGKPVAKPISVLVVDLKGRPVKGALVSFRSMVGGGSFNPQVQNPVETDARGIASIVPILGTSTAVNSNFSLDEKGLSLYRSGAGQGEVYSTRISINTFTAQVESTFGTLSIGEEFKLNAYPDKLDHLKENFVNSAKGRVNSFTGTFLFQAVDQYENPVSNVDVVYEALAPEAATERVLPTEQEGLRNLTLFDPLPCKIYSPIHGEWSSSKSVTVLSGHVGAYAAGFFGNTVDTRYTIKVSALGSSSVPALKFTLSTFGTTFGGEYYPTQLQISRIVNIDSQGRTLDAVNIGETLKVPLTTDVVLLVPEYKMEKQPTKCTKKLSDGSLETYDCWDIVWKGIVNTEKVVDGDVAYEIVPKGAGGSVGVTVNNHDGTYAAKYTAPTTPRLNHIEAVGELTLKVPEVLVDSTTNKMILTGYRSEELPLRTVTLESGNEALFDLETEELIEGVSSATLDFGIYGVEVTSLIEPDVTLLDQFEIVVGETEYGARVPVQINYTIKPDSYTAEDATIDLYEKGEQGDNWQELRVGDKVSGAGSVTFDRGTRLDPKSSYHIQTVLNRGSEVEIKSESVSLKTLMCDLDIDSDNNAGWEADGTHNLPSGTLHEDRIENIEGAPGKVIKPGYGDFDKDGLPDFADGMDVVNGQKAAGASAAFVPVRLIVDGSILADDNGVRDVSRAKVKFSYDASDPAQVDCQNGPDPNDSSKTTWVCTPPTGKLRLWLKDGSAARDHNSVTAGGDYLPPDVEVKVSELGNPDSKGGYILYLEGINVSEQPGDLPMAVSVGVDGSDGSVAIENADQVKMTVLLAALVPDYNHDKMIDAADQARAALGEIFYFWINDDDDSGETGGDDISIDNTYLHGNKRDYFNDEVDGVRDLIDFFPVALDVKTLAQIFPTNLYTYNLKSADQNLKIVFPNLTTAMEKNYLNDVETARAVALKSSFPVPQDKWPNNFEARRSLDTLLASVAEQDALPVILLEGIKSGTAPLVLGITDQAENQVFTTSLNLSLAQVEQMFRHKNLIKVLSEHSEYHLPGHDSVPSDMGMTDRGVIGNDGFDNIEHFYGFDADNDGNDFIHVHGYNINGQAARGEQSEAFKRLYWSGNRARFWGITWYGWESQWTSLERTPNYHVNVRHAFNTGRLLKEFVNQNVTGYVTVFAHSLGNMVVSSAIKEGMSVARYLMVNAAVAEEAFTPQEAYDGGAAYESGVPWRSATKEQMYHPAWRYPDGAVAPFANAYQPQLWASEWYKLFAPDDGRSTLTWRNRFARVRDLTNITNTFVYYAPTDEAFRPFLYTVDMAANDKVYQPNTTDWPGVEELFQNAFSSSNTLGAYAFALQELLKGRIWLGDDDSDSGGWGFNLMDNDYWHYSDPVNQKKVLIPSYVANAIPKEQLRTRPFFLMNSDFGFLYNDPPISVSAPLREELLANEIPALTFAAGHRGVEELSRTLGRNIDIRLTFAVDKPWPQDRLNGYEWKHSDIYVVAYPYLSGLYDEWAKRIKGE